MESENFPRGGRTVSKANPPAKRKNEYNLFQVEKAKKPKKSRKDKHYKGDEGNKEELWQASVRLQGTLSYNKIHEGLIVQCCIRHITNLTLKVEFPGLTYGIVTINCISDAFTKRLESRLDEESDYSYNFDVREVVQIGELVPAKILSIKNSETGHKIYASINPKDINADKPHYAFKKGTLVWANVVSKLDHGYELSLGVRNCRVFLPEKNVDEGMKFKPGASLYCIVNKIESTSAVSTVTVSARRKHIDHPEPVHDMSMNDLIPGVQVEFFVQELTPHGIKGQFFGNCFGYIDETQIFEKVDVGNLHEGSILTAYVLFVEPITKITYLTLRPLEHMRQPRNELGKIMTGEVVSVSHKGVYLKFGKEKLRGFVTNKRLLSTLPQSTSMDMSEAIRKRYVVGSRLGCRILDYSYMEQVFLCTFEKKMLQEKIFTPSDLTIGERVMVKIEKIQEQGIVVKVGYVQGFVPNLHISNAKFSEKVKSKFAVGMEVDAKVLNVRDSNVLFTFKQALIESDKCLKNYSEAVVGNEYTGFVVQTCEIGALVAFYGDVSAWLSSNTLNIDSSGKPLQEQNADPREYFFVGQVINVYMAEAYFDRLLVSLHLIKRKKPLKIGDVVSGKITRIFPGGIDVQVGQSYLSATVPLAHLSPVPELCPLLLKLYKPGRHITKLMCIRNERVLIMSRREAVAYERRSLKVLSLRKIRENMLLRCSFRERLTNGILVSPPIRDYEDDVLIMDENITFSDDDVRGFNDEQNILASVLNVDPDAKKIELALEPVGDIRRHNIILNDLCDILEELKYIIYYNKTRKSSEITDYKIGERVNCTVYKLESDGTQWVTLPNGTSGKVAPHLASNTKVGGQVEGVVLDYNVVDGNVDMCTKKSVKQVVNKAQGGGFKKPINAKCVVRIILVTRFYVLGIALGKGCNRQLVYMPLELKETITKNKIKAVISRIAGNKVIVLPKKYVAEIAKCKERRAEKREAVVEEPIETDEESNANDIGSDDDKLLHFESDEEQEEAEGGTENSSDDEMKEEEDDEDADDSEDQGNDLSGSENEQDIDSDSEAVHEKIKQKDARATSSWESDSDEVAKIKDEDEDDSDADSVVNNRDQDDDDSDKVLKVKDKIDVAEKRAHIKTSKNKEAVLSGAHSFYAPDNEDLVKQESSSDEEDDDKESNKTKKKKKLSPAERAQMARQEEERISKIEKELADATVAPQSAEQFERLLLANPNSSELWLQYMAMHVATTELEKARTVARKAIDTISMTLVKEKFNVWIALLNLENMYGTKESFEKVFEDAVKCNDSLDIYLSVIKMLSTSGKLVEMEEKIRKVKSKEKQNTKMWFEVGRVYYSLGKYKEGRNIKEAALKSIQDNKRQFDLIVRFGIMEFQSGEFEQAVANFETILDTYPAKTNIWIIYVDQLVKLKKIEAARLVLERAAGLKLGLKPMKTIFQKFVAFEEQHGSAETVQDVKKRAREYVEHLSRSNE